MNWIDVMISEHKKCVVIRYYCVMDEYQPSIGVHDASL